uniref:ferroxidase n=1 Tax=Leptobrachium leishanense TaxID=445787 RepID=A0A8C5M8P0_9ANUR
MKLFTIFLLFLFGYVCEAAQNRTYYFAIKEINWDYAPSEKNLISGKPIAEDKKASTYLLRDTNRIGRIYKKAVYLQYTDDSYTVEIKKPNWLGYLGPIIRAEVGDNLIIHLKNFASRQYGLHPHGVQYTKENEGALYPDDVSESHKEGAQVMPGESFTYNWEVVKDQGPTPKDDDCITRIYHSHIDAPTDIYSGLIGTMLICKEGFLTRGKYKAYKEFVVMASVVDENRSWYLDENIETFCTDPASVDKNDEEFQKSNRMNSINGYVFGNLPGLCMCDSNKVKWYLFGMGNEIDIHSIYFEGQVFKQQHHHVDSFNLFPATMVQAEMVTHNVGKWLFSCQIFDHFKDGMQAMYEVKNCSKKATQNNPRLYGNVRQYYIAAEEIIWSYGPTTMNPFTGLKLDDPESTESELYFIRNDTRIGGTFKKAVYVEYTDATFTKRKERLPEEEHLGILGPIILAEVGDTVKVTFRNNASYPFNIQAHGVKSKKETSTASHRSRNTAKGRRTYECAYVVSPGKTYTYNWYIQETSGPTELDQNCLPWLYFSSANPSKDPSAGLVGPLLVCKSLKRYKQNGMRNFFMLPTVFDENESWYQDENIRLFLSDPSLVDKDDTDFQEASLRPSINGYMFGNQPGLDMCIEDTVVWNMMGIGNEVDVHGIQFSGNIIEDHSKTTDTTNVFPHTSHSVVMIPDNIGTFRLGCMTVDHLVTGMKQRYRVHSCGKQRPAAPKVITKTYYIAAEELEWDYAPNRTWEHELYKHRERSPGDIYLNRTGEYIGSKYIKALYREYTDETFTTVKNRTEEHEHLGILGPLIKANVGDQIKIVFHNMATRTYSIYAQGVQIEGDIVYPAEPGNTQTYIWNIKERSGPTRHGDTDCLTWVYYSSVNQEMDTYSGLIGPLLICKKSTPRVSSPTHRHFFLLFMIFNENFSWYFDKNIETYALQPIFNRKDRSYFETNKMHAINGKLYANLHGLTMYVGDDVTWHLIGLGGEIDIHTVHFHAHSFKYKKGFVYQNDVFDLFPGIYQTVEMKAIVPGTWLLHCHVTNHIHGGMETVYTVLERKESTVQRLINYLLAS